MKKEVRCILTLLGDVLGFHLKSKFIIEIISFERLYSTHDCYFFFGTPERV